MKTVKIFLATLVFFLAANAVSAQDGKKDNKVKEVVFSVNMHCGNCEQKVIKNMPYEKGVKDLSTNLDKQLVTVNYQSDKTDKEKLKKAIEKLGFTCKEVEPEVK